jgi:O-antigen ligase
VSILFSIAVSQILLALAVVALLLSGERIQLPPIKLPLALFIAGTVLALIVSPHPAEGLPQIRKLYVLLELVVVYSCLRDLRLLRYTFLTWAGFASIDGIRGMVQFAHKLREAHQLGRSDYSYYVAERITGFMSHWNTFAGQQMFALLMLASFLFFAPARRRSWLWWGCAALMGIAILLAETRAVWIGLFVGGLYLLWHWKRWAIAAIPVAVVAVYYLSPPVVHDRFDSLLHPKGVDSNQFRMVTWRTGLRMIEAHPVFGIGPEGPKYHFQEWVPAEIPRPLPPGWYGHLHNIYLQYSAERGIPTMLILLWLLGKMIWDFRRGLRIGSAEERWLLHGAIAVILAALAEGFFEYNLGDSEVLTMFLVVAACGYAALSLQGIPSRADDVPRDLPAQRDGVRGLVLGEAP